jgi:uncharacterized protein (TIGR02186 family)
MRATRPVLLAILFAVCLFTPLEASETEATAASSLVTESSKSVIEVGLRYNGDRIDFSGSLAGTGADDIIAKLTSPAETVKINVKGRVGPFWMNTRQYEVENVPSMHQIQASRPLDELTTPELAEELQLGFDTIKDQMKYHILKGTDEGNDAEIIFQGLMQIKTEDELYAIDDTGRIEIKDGGTFEYYFDFPPDAKPGHYNVDYFLMKDKKLVGRASQEIHIKKVGLVAYVEQASQKQPVLYGICAVLIALGTGLAVGFVFKDTGH